MRVCKGCHVPVNERRVKPGGGILCRCERTKKRRVKKPVEVEAQPRWKGKR